MLAAPLHRRVPVVTRAACGCAGISGTRGGHGVGCMGVCSPQYAFPLLCLWNFSWWMVLQVVTGICWGFLGRKGYAGMGGDGCWDAPGDHRAGQGPRGQPQGGKRLLTPEDAPGDMGRPHLDGTKVAHLPAFSLLRFLNNWTKSRLLPGVARIGRSDLAQLWCIHPPVAMGWGMDLGTPVPLVQLCRELDNAACKPCAARWSLPWSSTQTIN